MERKDNDNVPTLTPTQLYKLRHTLIDMRRDQYHLKDIFKPTRLTQLNRLNYIMSNGEDEIVWNDINGDYVFAPLGLVGPLGLAHDVFYNLRAVTYYPFKEGGKYTIDFRKPEHIYKLMDMYEELITCAENNPDSLMGAIAQTLDYYIAHANLKPQHYVIIDMKKKHQLNKDIAVKVNEMFGLSHTENYISTIWTKKICAEIAAAAVLHYDSFLARDGDEFWKKCSCCGIEKLRDNRNFVKRARSFDGLSTRCKCCDRLMRGSKATEE